MAAKRRTQEISVEERDYLSQLGTNIRKLRLERNFGVEELADLSGVHRTHLWKIEKGQLSAGAVTYLRLATQLGLAPGALFPEPDPPLPAESTEAAAAPSDTDSSRGSTK